MSAMAMMADDEDFPQTGRAGLESEMAGGEKESARGEVGEMGELVEMRERRRRLVPGCEERYQRKPNQTRNTANHAAGCR